MTTRPSKLKTEIRPQFLILHDAETRGALAGRVVRGARGCLSGCRAAGTGRCQPKLGSPTRCCRLPCLPCLPTSELMLICGVLPRISNELHRSNNVLTPVWWQVVDKIGDPDLRVLHSSSIRSPLSLLSLALVAAIALGGSSAR